MATLIGLSIRVKLIRYQQLFSPTLTPLVIDLCKTECTCSLLKDNTPLAMPLDPTYAPAK